MAVGLHWTSVLLWQKSARGPKAGVKKGVKCVTNFVGKGGFAVFATGEEVVSKWVKGLAACAGAGGQIVG